MTLVIGNSCLHYLWHLHLRKKYIHKATDGAEIAAARFDLEYIKTHNMHDVNTHLIFGTVNILMFIVSHNPLGLVLPDPVTVALD